MTTKTISTYAAIAIDVIREHGYVNARQAADQGKACTRDLVTHRWALLDGREIEPDADHVAFWEGACALALGMEGEGGFARDARAVGQQMLTTSNVPGNKKMAGLALWILGAHAKAQQPQAPAMRVDGDLSRIVELLDEAAQHIKWPKVRLATADGKPVVLSRAGDRAKAPGSVNVTDGGRYGDNVWYGRIGRDGTFQGGRTADEGVQALLADLAADPAGMAAAYGQRTGSCCFCGRELTDERSTSVGYGPVCAGRYGLPWGAPADAEATA